MGMMEKLMRLMAEKKASDIYISANAPVLIKIDGVCHPVTPQLLQQHGFVHGGVLSYVADNALTYAGGTAMRVPVVTSEFKINYLRPAVGELLIARAQAVHHGRAQAVCRCDVFVVQAGTEKLCAVAQGTIAALPPRDGAAPAPAGA